MNTKIKSIIVLTSICLVVVVLLVVTNHFTKDKIAANNNKAAFEACFVVMPDAENFEEVDLSKYTNLPASLKNAYKETSGLGYAYKLEVRGKEAGLVIMVGIDSNGKITKSTVVSSNETPSYFGGEKEQQYSDKFTGKDSTLAGISTISGATLSTKAYMDAVMDAFTANAEIAGMTVVKSKEMLIAEILPNTLTVTTLTTTANLGTSVKAVYNSDQYDGLVVEVTINEINYYIGLGYNGKILGFSAASKEELSDGFTLDKTANNSVETELLSVVENIKNQKETLIFDAIGTSLKTVLGNENAELAIYNATFNMPKIEKALEYIPDYEYDISIKNISAEVQAIYEAAEGYVYLVKAQGHNGVIVLLVSVNKTGAIIDTKAILQKETADYTSDVWTNQYEDQYHGITSLPNDLIHTYATVTSTTYSISVRCALKAYELMTGGNN